MKCEMNGKSINLFFLSSQIQYNISINNFIEANIKTFWNKTQTVWHLMSKVIKWFLKITKKEFLKRKNIKIFSSLHSKMKKKK